MSHPKRVRFPAIFVLAIPLSVGSCSESPPSPSPQTTVAQASIVAVDPVTGRLGAPGASIVIPRNPQNFSVAGLTQAVQLTGGAIVNLQGRFRYNAVATVGQDGELKINCDHKSHDHKAGHHAE